MDIRKMIDVTNVAVIDDHVARERFFQNQLLKLGPRHMDKAQRRQLRQSRQRVQQLEQAYTDWTFSDGKRDLKYGES